MSDTRTKSMLLKNGVVLIHDSQNHVVPTQTDILIEDGTITRIGAQLETASGTEVVDCTDKVISPSFIDTHHHGWQTQPKGRHANEQLLEYLVTVYIDSILTLFQL
ncbi:hypothetical protein C7974DRAFT_445658 [Boeremia exigua]|uniref:uncharacterized protein n=1 Tax=Boeremia exigua TaxID=749465 RepID=UPI001E8EBB96|nr:uncharacterized protein C7974DRAFT_445658 [Boeremia exigua]KAH6611812.1 hypothetical protein C7974DRAFT_445658 [Boeremia exigua]